MATLADHIAQTALQHYERRLPTKGKPKDSEWTVFASIVATTKTSSTSSDHGLDLDQPPASWVVSCATGTKCTASQNDRTGCVLHDSHAEVLARRGLVRSLWMEVAGLIHPPGVFDSTHKAKSCLLEQDETTNKIRIRRDLLLHLYISDSPCGDASIYPLVENEDDVTYELQYTGAKVIVSEHTKVTGKDCGGDHQLLLKSSSAIFSSSYVAREDVQLLGKLRTKAGRSNIEAARRSTSMSCSDKIVRWMVLGLQGRHLMKWIQDPIRFATIVVSQDPRVRQEQDQLDALERAISTRVALIRVDLEKLLDNKNKMYGYHDLENFVLNLPKCSVSVVRSVFSRGKSARDATKAHRKRLREESDQKICNHSPAGVSVNWLHLDPEVELVIGARGIRQGKKPKSEQDFRSMASRLSRNALTQLALDNHLLNCDTRSKVSYQLLKEAWSPRWYGQVRERLFQCGPLAGWIVSDSDFAIGEKHADAT
jgi:tRNA-specific adenosine deaminase 1